MVAFYNSIKQKVTNNNAINNIYIIFALTVLSYQIFYLIVPFRQAIEFLHLDFISPLLAIIGFILFAFDLVFERVLFKEKYTYFLVAIIGVMIISAILNLKYALVNNAKVIIWQITQMLVIFPIHKRISIEKIKKIFKWYFLSITIVFVIANLISLVEYFLLISYEVSYQGGLIKQGFSEGRLFGIFGSPHFASVFMLILSFLSIYVMVISRRRAEKWFYGIAVFIHFLYAVASGTRSVIVAAIAAVFVITLLWMEYKHSFKIFTEKRVLKGIVSVVLAVCISMGTLGAFVLSEKAMKGIVRTYSDSLIIGDTQGSDDNSEIPEIEIEIDRMDVDINNISNHRFEIWNNYLSVISSKAKSLIFGISPGGYMIYIKEKFPDLFIVEYIREKYPQMYAKNLIYDTHNAYIGALVMTGVLGLGLLLMFLICGFIRTIKYIKKNKEISTLLYIVLLIIIFSLVASFFDSDLFFKCTSTSVIFWLSTGALLKITEKK